MKCIDCGKPTHGTRIDHTRLAICPQCAQTEQRHAPRTGSGVWGYRLGRTPGRAAAAGRPLLTMPQAT